MRGWIRIALTVSALLAPSMVQAKCQVLQLAELNVTMVGEKPMVDIGINGHQVRFVADSGAFFSTISPGSAKELSLTLTDLPMSFHIVGVGGRADVSLAKVKDLTLAGIPLHNVPFLVGGSEIGPGAGLLGQNVLGIGDVEYDLEHSAVRLMRPKGCGTQNFAYWAGDRPVSILETAPRDAHQTHTIATVYLNGAKIRAIFDTGASDSVLSLSAAARAGIKPDSPGVTPSGYSHGVGRHIVQTWIASFDDFKVGGEEIHKARIRIGDIGLSDADMLIGADFFLSHRIYVANGLQKMFFTYDGGPVFNVNPRRAVDGSGTVIALPTLQAAEPKDASGYSQRGTVFAARGDFTQAEADLTRAIELAPKEGRYYYQRATIRITEHRLGMARNDLDQALILLPTDPEAHIARARLRLLAHERPEALQDVDAADRALAPASDQRLELGAFYENADLFDRAIPQYDAWIRAHPDDSRRPTALNGRCWSRALAGRDLPIALSDCNAAIRSRRNNANYLDSRGLVQLRMGNFSGAISDYSAALAINPKSAWSLYGRALAERHLKQANADTDRAAALAISPHLDERFRSLGIS